MRSGRTIISGVSGVIFRRRATWRFLTVRGMGGYWWSAWRNSPPRNEWKRAYLEINDFEEQLAARDIALAKFWVHISKEEQLRRFKERQDIEFKRYKITDEDWRNRKKWDAYKEAINDMVAHTSTEFAPWTVVPGNDKHFARVQILKTLCEALERLL